MRLSRAAVLALLLAFAPVSTVRAQADPLQEANQLLRQGQLDRAMERVDSYLTARPKDARGRFLKGLILTEQNKPNDAIKVFSDLSQDYPELPEPYNNLAVLYASQGAYDKARNALELAIRTHPSYATAHENLGDIYAKMASQAYDKALQLDRSNQAAQGKLNLIKDLFSQSTRQTANIAAVKPDAAPATTLATAPATAPASQRSAAPPASAPPSASPQPPSSFASATPATSSPAPSTGSPLAVTAPPAAKAPAAAPAPAPAAPPARATQTPPATEAPAPATASKPAPAEQKAEAAPAPGNDDVMRSVNGWAKAWASNDVRGYLSYYAPDFQTPPKMSRTAWEAERKTRIAKPRKIEVDVVSPKVTFDGKNRASVSFKQHYRSGGLNVSSNKTLVMVKNGDKWLIQQERAGS